MEEVTIDHRPEPGRSCVRRSHFLRWPRSAHDGGPSASGSPRAVRHASVLPGMVFVSVRGRVPRAGPKSDETVSPPERTPGPDGDAGDRSQPAAALLPSMYAELRRLAAAQLSRLRPGQTLQPTALVHEAYMKLVGHADPGWEGRRHFFGAAAQAMRELLVEHVRRRTALKRGGGQAASSLDAALAVEGRGPALDDVLAIDAALARLEAEHPRKARVAIMRYFGGLSDDEIAEGLGITTRTVERDWRFARAYLVDVLHHEPR